MEEHLLKLAGEHGVNVTWVSGWSRAESFPAAREVLVPRIHTGADYLIGLHEIGHCADPLALSLHTAQGPRESLLCEAAAWSWALANADPSFLKPSDLQAFMLSRQSHAARVLFPQMDPAAAV